MAAFVIYRIQEVARPGDPNRDCGFAALQCGKAVPFRRRLFSCKSRLCLRPRMGGVASENSMGLCSGTAEPYRIGQR
jgi:hypothetical protein